MKLLSFPLLAKELTEIAARRRTYVTRVVYALLLYAVFAANNRRLIHDTSRSPSNFMGAGEEMFASLIFLQLIGIVLFLPAFAAGLITQEKERDSLVLLFLTELRPWQILLQKIASGLVSIVSFLLIGLPLGALCYTYGGISPITLFTGVYVLFLTCLQVGAFALMWSARARTTVGAFIGTYVGAAAFVGIIGLGSEFIDRELGRGSNWNLTEYALMIFPPQLGNQPGTVVSAVLLESIPSLATTLIFVLLARFYFVRHAFAPPTNGLLVFFRWIDGWMHRANQRIGGIAFRSRDRTLPEDDPIAWRELSRRSLGRPHYLVRILVALEILAVGLGIIGVHQGVRAWDLQSAVIPLIIAILGTLAVLSLSVVAANAFVSERVNQTMEVLLTTPLSAREIVRQKARMLGRFRWVLAVPLMTFFAIEAWIEYGQWQYRYSIGGVQGSQLDTVRYLLCSALILTIYLPLVQWLSLWIGLKMRTRFRAILTALGVIVGWCAFPLIVGLTFQPDGDDLLSVVLLFTWPLAIPGCNEFNDWSQIAHLSPWFTMALSFPIYAGILFFFRQRCLRNADAYLRG
jgi:ABC-type transport system involved in multi-copper enzyme maturation permease subunit